MTFEQWFANMQDRYDANYSGYEDLLKECWEAAQRETPNDPPNYEADEGPLSEKQVEQVQQGAWMFQSSLFLKDE